MKEEILGGGEVGVGVEIGTRKSKDTSVLGT